MATKLKQYMFTFEGGGWNTVWAKSIPGARKQAAVEYPNLPARLDSFHVATREGMEAAMTLFW